MIEFFNTIVCSFTVITFWTLLSLVHAWADLRLIGAERAPPVLVLVVVVWAALQVVILWIRFAGLYLEKVQIQESYGL